MGEVAEMMVNGFLCEGCGVILDGEEPGYPRYCGPTCARNRGAEWIDPRGEYVKRKRRRTGPYRRRSADG